MEMSDRLSTRPKWFDIFLYYAFIDAELHSSFSSWRKHKKIKSLDKAAYCFLLSVYGRDWIKHHRFLWSKGFAFTYEHLEQIIKTKWIKEIDE